MKRFYKRPLLCGLLSLLYLPGNAQQSMKKVHGVVYQRDAAGKKEALAYATIAAPHSSLATQSDSNGVFNISIPDGIAELVASYTGYEPDTIHLQSDLSGIIVILEKPTKLNEIVISKRQNTTRIGLLATIKTENIGKGELMKAACCNLSESFETNPSVDVSYNDAITGSKQIQLLGLSGNYTQLTVENLPGLRGLATPLGLNSIAGPWIESIQLTKGVGSVANGFESIAGQINVELKKPESAERLLANVYVNDFGKTDLNLNLEDLFG